jgi:hypothetical protein
VADDFWKMPRRSSRFAGFRFSNVSPETEGTQPPSIKLWYVVVFSVVVGMAVRVPYCGHRPQQRWEMA